MLPANTFKMLKNIFAGGHIVFWAEEYSFAFSLLVLILGVFILFEF
jgi:hypothetical protein